VVNGALVGASTHCRVTEGHELRVVGSEHLPRVNEALTEDDDHVAAHQESGVGLLGVVDGGVVIDFELLVVGVIHQLLELLAKLVDLSQIQWPEIGKEGLVDQIVVDAKIKCVLARLWRVLVTDPIQTAGNDLNRLVQGVLLFLINHNGTLGKLELAV
jgi:hypothetical protein